MPDVTIDAFIRVAAADDVYRRLCDFASYPRYTDAVREVDVVALGAGAVEARWAINFRNGVLCWTERDTFDDLALTITFRQTDGDFDRFDGTWTVREHGGAVAVRFACTFDLGMPSLAPIIDPIACEALTENIQLILHGLLGDDIAFHDPEVLLAAAGER